MIGLDTPGGQSPVQAGRLTDGLKPVPIKILSDGSGEDTP
jgi:hypothetical protein